MPEYFVPPTQTLENTANFTRITTSRETNASRTVNLIIRDDGGKYLLSVQSKAEEFSVDTVWQTEIPLTSAQLWGAVRSCQRWWHDHAVYYSEDGSNLLQKWWDLTQRPDINSRMLGPLAAAGADLFNRIFFPRETLGDPHTYGMLREIGEALRALTRRESARIRVTSDTFFAPWNLIYSHPLTDTLEGGDATWDGFWGYRHVVEHVPFQPAKGIFAGDFPLMLGMQLDENIDSDLGVRCNTEVLEHLATYQPEALRTELRTTSRSLASAFSAEPLVDQILYFCCHAKAESDNEQALYDESFFTLTDKQRTITTQRLESVLGARSFARHPIVFLNACESARMNSLFYQGFASTFWERGASAVIGTQTEIPAVFAGLFAKRFFEEFFKGGRNADGTPRHPVGDVLLQLRREFLDKYNNPLGLLYSLYRGYDVYLPEEVPHLSNS